jgi:hypothetical protein
MMHKEKIFKAYSINEAKYKDACTVLNVKPADVFPSALIDDLETVLELFKEGLNVKTATERYGEIVASRQSTSTLDEVIERSLEGKDEELDRVVPDLLKECDNLMSALPVAFRHAMHQKIIAAFNRASEHRPVPSYPAFAEPVSAALPEANVGNP